MDIPRNESDTIDLFKETYDHHGWEIKHLQSGFPDATISKDGQQLIAEFEHKSRNFLVHKHPADGCDLIICWHNNWLESPLPVWALDELKGIDAICEGSEQQLNIRRPRAAEAARQLAAYMKIPISEVVELVMIAAKANMLRHIDGRGHPDAFRAALIEQGIANSDDERG